MRDKKRTKIIFLCSLIATLILVYISSAWLLPTLSRYIKRTQDEIRAHYTALYFASTGEGKTIAMEDGIGYIDFDLRNYVGENVTFTIVVTNNGGFSFILFAYSCTASFAIFFNSSKNSFCSSIVINLHHLSFRST